MWNLWLPVSPARIPELAHEETHSRGPLQLHLWVLWQEVWEAGQCQIPQVKESPRQAGNLRCISITGWTPPRPKEVFQWRERLCRVCIALHVQGDEHQLCSYRLRMKAGVIQTNSCAGRMLCQRLISSFGKEWFLNISSNCSHTRLGKISQN